MGKTKRSAAKKMVRSSVRRLAVQAIDWVAFAERVPPSQRSSFNALKTRTDAIAAKLNTLPAQPAAIDWAYYKSAVALPGLVDEFEKKISALEIPMPVDTQSHLIDAQQAESEKGAVAYIEESKARIVELEDELKKWNSMVPFDQMTIEEFEDVFPDTKLNKEENPYWPHRPISECV